jgi:glycosyltransferase involved in cell wall biosynthesis
MIVSKSINFRKLVIISHTAHQMHPEHGPVGWGPTIREVNFLAAHWDEVVHVACLERAKPAGSSIPYIGKNIQFKAIPTFGGARWWQKFDIIFKAPKVILAVHKALKGATEVQIRLPMSMGVFLLPYFKWIPKRSFKLWVKYATNWGEPSKAASYRWQQRLINNNWLGYPVTINGAWPNQPSHCKTFENPCLTKEQYESGGASVNAKPSGPPFTLIFIGRVDADKGVDLLIDSLSSWPSQQIAKLHIVGEGPLLAPLKKRLEASSITAECHGFITQEAIFQLLAESHFLVLPSKSEGFPKVVAEGLNFGCLPLVSAVGSIPHYIKEGENGLLLAGLKSDALTNAVLRATHLKSEAHGYMIANARNLAQRFTFEAYLELLKKEVLRVS